MAEKHRQEHQQQDNHQVQQPSKIYSAELEPTWHEEEVSARSERPVQVAGSGSERDFPAQT